MQATATAMAEAEAEAVAAETVSRTVAGGRWQLSR